MIFSEIRAQLDSSPVMIHGPGILMPQETGHQQVSRRIGFVECQCLVQRRPSPKPEIDRIGEGLPTIHPEQSTRNTNQWLLDERFGLFYSIKGNVKRNTSPTTGRGREFLDFQPLCAGRHVLLWYGPHLFAFRHGFL